MFKLAKGINEVEWVNPPVLANSLSLTGPARGIRGHARRLSGQASIKCLQRDNTFTNRVVNEWNALPTSVVNATTCFISLCATSYHRRPLIVGYGQDKSVHYTDGFLRSFGRSNFWIAKINGLKYTDGLKNGLKNTGGQKYPLIVYSSSNVFPEYYCRFDHLALLSRF
ncbi:hypothetical protein BpHYR1_053785 [Brachionus plicatilis]|uniref:RNA-directed DNA polymerase from mobile element jockey-like n=1 Tax=Brachionus plicatilis TaxID=10195 RepID=A0A3M7PU64_BRAPC|nr:hypothetical protein BpHYR1_053785 [Brachionus plicatilis]